MEVSNETTDSTLIYNVTLTDLQSGTGIFLWMSLIVAVVSAVLALGLIVIVRDFLCGKYKSEQPIIGKYFNYYFSSQTCL
jgi:hypothetical protein